MTMIAVGQGLRGIANRGMAAVSRAEAIEDRQRMGIEAQEKAAEAQTLGTGAGIGGMVGANKLAAAARTADTAATVGNIAGSSGEVGLKYVSGGIESLGPAGGKVASSLETLSGATEIGKAAAETTQAVNAAIAGNTGAAGGVAGGAAGAGAGAGAAGGAAGAGAGAGAAGAAGTGAAAGGASGAMASLATLAAPVAIGLGVAFLLNKLFD